MTETMKKGFIQLGKPCPFFFRKLGEKKEKELGNIFSHSQQPGSKVYKRKDSESQRKMVNVQPPSKFIGLYWGFDLSPPLFIDLNDLPQ
jgi:hypothetical protein